jgi:hypothetical protein
MMPRTTIKRTALALAAIVALPTLLLSGYVSAWLLFASWVAKGGSIPSGPYTEARMTSTGLSLKHVAFAPIHDYIAAGRPGAGVLDELWRKTSGTWPQTTDSPVEAVAAPVDEDIERLLSDVPQ